MPQYADPTQKEFFNKDVQQKAGRAAQDVISWMVVMGLQLIKAVASFIGGMFRQVIGK